MNLTCPRCGGSGRAIQVEPRSVCARCHGAGTVPATARLLAKEIAAVGAERDEYEAEGRRCRALADAGKAAGTTTGWEYYEDRLPFLRENYRRLAARLRELQREQDRL